MPRDNTDKSFPPNAGIAIGPILFVVAILAILAAAIAAGSGGFTGRDGSSNKLKASAIIQIAEGLKVGTDRLISIRNVPYESIITDTSDTTGNTSLFSPKGGSVSRPSISMANNPLLDRWIFVRGDIEWVWPSGLMRVPQGLVAFLPVSRGVCAEINARVFNVLGVPKTNLGNLSPESPTPMVENPDYPIWTNEKDTAGIDGPLINRSFSGCIFNTSATLGDACPDISCFGNIGGGWALTQNTPKFHLISPAHAASVSDGEWGIGCDVQCLTGPTSPYFFYQVLAVRK